MKGRNGLLKLSPWFRDGFIVFAVLSGLIPDGRREFGDFSAPILLQQFVTGVESAEKS
jgi:hypothetical protein